MHGRKRCEYGKVMLPYVIIKVGISWEVSG